MQKKYTFIGSIILSALLLTSCVNNEVKTIKLNNSSLTLLMGQTDSLITSLTVTGDISKLPVTWTSSDLSVATIKNGLINAVRNGTTIITAKAGDKSAACQVEVINKLTPTISWGQLWYYGDAYGTKTDSIPKKQSHNFVIYLGSPLVNIQSYFNGTDDRVMLEINTDTIYKTSIPSGTYDMMTTLSRDQLVPNSIVPAYVLDNYPWGTWYFGKTNNDIVMGNVIINNSNEIYDLQYTLIDYYGNTISGTFHGVLTYNNGTQSAISVVKNLRYKSQAKQINFKRR